MSDTQPKTIDEILGYYGSRCAMQNGHGSKTPGVDYQNVKSLFKILLLQERLDELKTIRRDFDIDGDPYISLNDVHDRIAHLEQQIKEMEG